MAGLALGGDPRSIRWNWETAIAVLQLSVAYPKARRWQRGGADAPPRELDKNEHWIFSFPLVMPAVLNFVSAIAKSVSAIFLADWRFILSLVLVFTWQTVDKQQKNLCIQVFILHLKCQDKSSPDAGFLAHKKHQEMFGGRALLGPTGGDYALPQTP